MKTADRSLELLKDLMADLASRVTGFQPGSFRVGALEKIIREKTAEGCAPEELAGQISQESPELLSRIYEAIPVGETYFFRQPEHFHYLKTEVPPSLSTETFKVWSAGCATGEEAYSLAACLAGVHSPLEVLGTDLSKKHLEAAQKGAYSSWSLRGEELYPVFEKPLHPPYQVMPDIQAATRFLQHNLLEPLPGGEGPFDVIFCRNVLVYFTLPAARLALKHFHSSLAPEGLLFLGPADLSFLPTGFKPHGSAKLSIYKKATGPKPKTAAAPRPKLSRKGPLMSLPPLKAVAKAASPVKANEKSGSVALHLAVLEAIERENQPEADRLLKQLRQKFPDYLPGLYEAALWNGRNKKAAVAKALMVDLLGRLKGKDFQLILPGPRDLTVDFYLASALTFLKREET